MTWRVKHPTKSFDEHLVELGELVGDLVVVRDLDAGMACRVAAEFRPRCSTGHHLFHGRQTHKDVALGRDVSVARAWHGRVNL